MANNKAKIENNEAADQLDALHQKAIRNQKTIIWVSATIAVIVCLVLLYVYAIRRPGIQAADNAIGHADITMMTTADDSAAIAQYKNVADNYGYDAGSRAALNAAILLYQRGEYQQALDYVKKYNPKEAIIGAAAKSLEGDCYVNLDQLEPALEAFRKAVKISDKNPSYTPFFMMKEATVLREMKNYKAEADIYREILAKYPQYGAQYGIDFKKYLRRAELQAEQGE